MQNPAATPETVRVLLPLPLADAYDYLPCVPIGFSPPLVGGVGGGGVPQKSTLDLCDTSPLPNPPHKGEGIRIGTVVEVPFGARKMTGVVWGAGSGSVPAGKLKSIAGPAGLPPIPEASRAFVDWVAQYTVTPPGAVLKMLFGSMRVIQPKKKDDYATPLPDPDYYQPDLTGDQKKAASVLAEKVKAQEYSVTLLDGVTGSGKTEVFCEAVAECLRQGKQALVLLPEIAMTAALIDRFAKRFGTPPVQWHSGLTEKQRRLNWHSIALGHAKFILGARSALFLPYPDLGLIVVDEEHEAAYKQEEGVIYHGRDMAVVRGYIGKFPVVLSSATPSLETVFNVRQKKYDHVVLPTRFGKAAMPHIECVDMRSFKMPATQFISPPLFDALKQTIAGKQQAMLFLNRRGYAPLTLCRACGHRLNCPRCTSWLIEHKRSGQLHCHHCDYTVRLPDKCPTCSAEGKFAACGPGVERVAEEVKARLPEARFAIMASDTLDSPKAAQELVDKMARQELDILVGTQIMAKGYHFPLLTLVGVVDADLGLSGGDPRAAERTFQLLQQVAGRSGRAEDAGRVMMQTTAPDHPVMKALLAGDRDKFMDAELKEREAYRLPPVWRLASVTVSGEDMREVIELAEQLARTAPQNEHIRVLGPAPAPFAMLRGKYRHRLLMQAPRNVNLSRVVKEWLATVKPPRHLRILVDIDPYSFL